MGRGPPGLRPLSVPIGGCCAALLHTLLLQRHSPRAGWWKGWTLAATAPWLPCLALFGLLPWERFTEPAWEGAFFYTLGVTCITLGVLQWLALRRHIAAAGSWIVAPLLSLMTGWLLTALVNGLIVDLYRGWLFANHRFDEMFFLLGILFGIIYGMISGGVLVGLARSHGRSRMAVQG